MLRRLHSQTQQLKLRSQRSFLLLLRPIKGGSPGPSSCQLRSLAALHYSECERGIYSLHASRKTFTELETVAHAVSVQLYAAKSHKLQNADCGSMPGPTRLRCNYYYLHATMEDGETTRLAVSLSQDPDYVTAAAARDVLQGSPN